MSRTSKLGKLQFSLLTLLVFTTLVAILAGFLQLFGEKPIPIEERILGDWSGIPDIPTQPRFMSEDAAINWGFYAGNVAINYDHWWRELDRGTWEIMDSDGDKLIIKWGRHTYWFVFDGNDQFDWKDPQMVVAWVFTRVGD